MNVFRSFLVKLNIFLFGKAGEFKLEEKIAIYTLFMSVIICFVGSIINSTMGMALPAIIVPLLLSSSMIIFYYIVRFRHKFWIISTPFLILCFLAVAVIWIFNAGMNGSNTLVFYTGFILSLVITKPKANKLVFISYLTILLSIHFIHYYYPEIIVPFHNESDRFIDLIITLLYTTVSIYMVITSLHMNYLNERKKATDRENELAVMNQTLNELNNTKDKFFSLIAHDLKNPLGTYRQLSKMMAESYEIFTEEERMHSLNMMKESSENIYNLLENLLEWSRSQRGMIGFYPEKINIFAIAENVISLLKLTAQNKEISIENQIHSDLIINADPNLVHTIIRNLISNSIKFSRMKGKIELSSVINSNEISILVRDFGVGMNQKTKNEIFQLDKVKSTEGTANEGGTGLGLILCKEFVEKHGGKIWVESEEEKGSMFAFSLPII